MVRTMSLRMCRILRPQLRQLSSGPVPIARPIHPISEDDDAESPQLKTHLVISCKRRELNHFSNKTYRSLDEIPLASKGWKHPKSRGDYFKILPNADQFEPEMHDVRDLGIDPGIVENLNKMGIRKLTEYQKTVVDKFSERPLLLAAETGCGKTLAYLIPIVQKLLQDNRKTDDLNSPRALVLVPNRELAVQIGEVAENLVGDRLNVKVVIGGRTKRLMLNADFLEVDILVGTPGALGKLAAVGVYKLNGVECTVLDEADTLMDDSFVDRLGGILKRVPQSQVILVSATLPKTLPAILAPIEKDLVHVTSPKLHRPLLNVTQKFVRVARSVKPSFMLEIAKANKQPLLVFTNKNETCNWLSVFLRENGLTCSNINGNMNFALRIEQWNNFIKGKSRILAATDVGSRGLNTTQIRHVVNYDFPIYAADYLHRVGRIGRIGSPTNCKATNFISGPEEVNLVQQIEIAVRKCEALNNVDGNITNIVQKRILKKMRQSDSM